MSHPISRRRVIALNKESRIQLLERRTERLELIGIAIFAAAIPALWAVFVAVL